MSFTSWQEASCLIPAVSAHGVRMAGTQEAAAPCAGSSPAAPGTWVWGQWLSSLARASTKGRRSGGGYLTCRIVVLVLHFINQLAGTATLFLVGEELGLGMIQHANLSSLEAVDWPRERVEGAGLRGWTGQESSWPERWSTPGCGGYYMLCSCIQAGSNRLVLFPDLILGGGLGMRLVTDWVSRAQEVWQ